VFVVRRLEDHLDTRRTIGQDRDGLRQLDFLLSRGRLHPEAKQSGEDACPSQRSTQIHGCDALLYGGAAQRRIMVSPSLSRMGERPSGAKRRAT